MRTCSEYVYGCVCVILELSKTSVVVGAVVRVRANEMVNNLSLRGKGTALLCDHELLWQPFGRRVTLFEFFLLRLILNMYVMRAFCKYYFVLYNA